MSDCQVSYAGDRVIISRM